MPLRHVQLGQSSASAGQATNVQSAVATVADVTSTTVVSPSVLGSRSVQVALASNRLYGGLVTHHLNIINKPAVSLCTSVRMEIKPETKVTLSTILRKVKKSQISNHCPVPQKSTQGRNARETYQISLFRFAIHRLKPALDRSRIRYKP